LALTSRNADYRDKHPDTKLKATGYFHKIGFNMGYVGLATDRPLIEAVDAAIADIVAKRELPAMAKSAGMTYVPPTEPDVLEAISIVDFFKDYVMATRQTSYPPSWRWRIMRRGNPHETIPDKPGANRKPPIRLSIANDHQPHNPINNQLDDGNQPIVNPQETPYDNRQTSIRSSYWSPIGTQAKADLVDGYTQLVTDRVRSGWSCNLVTFVLSATWSTTRSRQSHEGRGPPDLLDPSDQGS
jgi:hypothetical protein